MFVDRTNGVVTGAYPAQQYEGQEEVAADHADVIAFLDAQANAVPGQVSAGQLVQALAELDLLDAVDSAVEQADAMTQRLWARAAFFPRNDPMVIAIAEAVVRTSEQMDDLFRLAATK